MLIKEKEKSEAIRLRKGGFSYNEILNHVNVSKSTLSLWLRDVGLAQHQAQRLTEKRRVAQKIAQASCRSNRIARETVIIVEAKKEIGKISPRELWLIGTSLYWAEGSKQKEHNVSQKVSFSNSDPKMILLFQKWLTLSCGLEKTAITPSIYIHRTGNVAKAKKFWERLLDMKIEKIYFKNHNPKTPRKNSGENYYGLIRFDVKTSTDLNRKIKGWTNGIIESIIGQ
jgi:hypothetical protein